MPENKGFLLDPFAFTLCPGLSSTSLFNLPSSVRGMQEPVVDEDVSVLHPPGLTHSGVIALSVLPVISPSVRDPNRVLCWRRAGSSRISKTIWITVSRRPGRDLASPGFPYIMDRIDKKHRPLPDRVSSTLASIFQWCCGSNSADNPCEPDGFFEREGHGRISFPQE